MHNHPNLLDSADSLLVIVDIQDSLLTTMPEHDRLLMITNSGKLLQAAQILAVPVLLTEQYPKGLGKTTPAICEHLPVATQTFEKTGFSCCTAAGFNDALAACNRQQIILVGQESHICILQTALALLSLGYQVYVVADAVCSRQTAHKVSALQRMTQQGVTVICYESVLFEWLKDARHPDFKAISSLLR